MSTHIIIQITLPGPLLFPHKHTEWLVSPHRLQGECRPLELHSGPGLAPSSSKRSTVALVSRQHAQGQNNIFTFKDPFRIYINQSPEAYKNTGLWSAYLSSSLTSTFSKWENLKIA